jgi:hypothetical protein
MKVCNICFEKDCTDNHGSSGKQIVEIDDEILDTIKLLNQKGYATMFCCGGHIRKEWVSAEMYIVFTPSFNHTHWIQKDRNMELVREFTPITTVPNSKWEIDNKFYSGGTVIRYSQKNQAALRRLFKKGKTEQILAEFEEQRKSLHEWAEGLPENKVVEIII